MSKDLYKLEFTKNLEGYCKENNPGELDLARVIKEHKECYIINNG